MLQNANADLSRVDRMSKVFDASLEIQNVYVVEVQPLSYFLARRKVDFEDCRSFLSARSVATLPHLRYERFVFNESVLPDFYLY